MRNLLVFLAFSLFSFNLFAIDGFECVRSDGQAVLTATFMDATRATVQEVEEDLGFAVTSDWEENIYSGKPLYRVTTFNLDNGGVLDILEVDAYIVGLLRFPSDSIPSFYECEQVL